MLVSDGEDLRKLPLTMRKTNLARLLHAVSTAFIRHPSNRARSARSCSGMPV
jgi:hypothetical protein